MSEYVLEEYIRNKGPSSNISALLVHTSCVHRNVFDLLSSPTYTAKYRHEIKYAFSLSFHSSYKYLMPNITFIKLLIEYRTFIY